MDVDRYENVGRTKENRFSFFWC